MLFHETVYLTIKDELDYMEKIASNYTSGGLIDLPQIQGAIYSEHCRSCLVDYDTIYEERGTDCKFCHYLPAAIKMESNKFADNQDGMTFYEEHSLERASHFYADGGALYNFTKNEFLLSTSMFDTVAEYKLPSYTAHLPSNFFKYLQSPLFRIKIPSGIDSFYDALLDTTDENLEAVYNDTSNFSVANITFYRNFFDT